MGLSETRRAQLIGKASPVLVEGEEVVDVTVGIAEVKRNGQSRRRRATILVTDRRVVLFSKRLGRYDVQEYAFGRLAGVDHHLGPITGQLNLRASGGSADIWQVYKKDVGRVAQAIRDRMASVRQGSVADEIDKFARLRNEGVITEEELAAQKARLLS